MWFRKKNQSKKNKKAKSWSVTCQLSKSLMISSTYKINLPQGYYFLLLSILGAHRQIKVFMTMTWNVTIKMYFLINNQIHIKTLLEDILCFYFIIFNCKMLSHGAGEMAKQLNVHIVPFFSLLYIVLIEDPNSVPWTIVMWLTIASNFSFRGTLVEI